MSSRSGLSRAERDAYLASRLLGDLHAAQEGPSALAGRVARRELRRRLYAAGVPIVPAARVRRARPTATAPAMSPLGAVAVLLGLVVLVGGIIACAVTGAWAGLVLVLPAGLAPMLWAGRGGRDGLPRR